MRLLCVTYLCSCSCWVGGMVNGKIHVFSLSLLLAFVIRKEVARCSRVTWVSGLAGVFCAVLNGVKHVAQKSTSTIFVRCWRCLYVACAQCNSLTRQYGRGSCAVSLQRCPYVRDSHFVKCRFWRGRRRCGRAAIDRWLVWRPVASHCCVTVSAQLLQQEPLSS